MQVGGHQLSAAEFIDIDSSILAFNELDDNVHPKDLVQIDEEEESVLITEKPPNLSEVLEMMRKLHLFSSTRQHQLHTLISDLDSQLTDIYLTRKQRNKILLKIILIVVDFFHSEINKNKSDSMLFLIIMLSDMLDV